MPHIEQIPIILLTGFLGAGKTTLLARWLGAPEFAGAMVIVNELGEVGLDHRLLTTSTDVPLLLDSGCACCAAQEDLVATLERLFWDRLHKRIARFDWVLIETTGIADPLPVIDGIRRHVLVNERYRIAGVVTALDAIAGLSRLPEFPECRNQLAAANVVIVTKADLATPRQIADTRARLEEIAGHALQLTSANGDLPAAELLAALGRCAECGVHGHDHAHHHYGQHDHEHEHEHAHEPASEAERVQAEHAGGVSSAFLPLPAPQPWQVLIAALDTMMEGYGRSLLRMKGIVRLDGVPGYHAVQATPGQGITRSEVPIDPAELAGEPVRTGFTLISAGEPAAGLASSFNAILAVKATWGQVGAQVGASAGTQVETSAPAEASPAAVSASPER